LAPPGRIVEEISVIVSLRHIGAAAQVFEELIGIIPFIGCLLGPSGSGGSSPGILFLLLARGGFQADLRNPTGRSRLWALHRTATEAVVRLLVGLRHPSPLAPVEVLIVGLCCLRPFVCEANLADQFGPRSVVVAAASFGLILLGDILQEVV
jgi:hypothetical protein